MKKNNVFIRQAAPYLIFGAAALLLMLLVDGTEPNIALQWICFALILLSALAIAVFAVQKKLSDARFFILILSASFFLHLAYVLYSTYRDRQHDVDSVEHVYSHAGYILHFVNNGLSLPNFDPRLTQYYHPPFWHMSAAAVVSFLTSVGQPLVRAFESLQFFSLFISSCTGVVAIRLLKALDLKGLALRVPAALLVFHPVFVYMSGFLNNDLLAIFFQFTALLFAVRWHKSPTFGNIVGAAFAVGLGMMTKLSAALVAPGIAIVFLWKFFGSIRMKQQPLRIVGQFSVFAAICAPLGLWWQVRSAVLYGLPLGYVPSVALPEQYVGQHSVFARLFIPQLRFPYVSLLYFNQYEATFGVPQEYNIPAALLKTSMFGEWTLGATGKPIGFLSYILFWLNILIVLFAVYAMVVVIVRAFRQKSGDLPVKLMFAAVFMVLNISQFIFCFNYPFVCTENIRYIVPTILAGCVFIGYWLREREGRQKIGKPLRIAATSSSALFAALSSGVYILLSGLI